MPKLVYVDAGVLLAAVRGSDPIAQEAFSVLDDPDARFASSIFVRLEVLPKALYNRRFAEAQFYEAFFVSVSVWVEPTPQLIQVAYDMAVTYGLAAMDALHVAAAASVGAAEFVTSERQVSPLFRASRLLPIRTIASVGSNGFD